MWIMIILILTTKRYVHTRSYWKSIKISTGDNGDMNKSTYDMDNNNKVDDADLVNGLTVETAVPANGIYG